MEEAVGGVDAVEHFGDFAAEEAACDGVGGVAGDLDGTLAAIGGSGDGDEHAATIGAIEGADGMDDPGGACWLHVHTLS